MNALKNFRLKLLSLLLLGTFASQDGIVAKPIVVETPNLGGEYTAKKRAHPFVFATQEQSERLLQLHSTASEAALARLQSRVEKIVAAPEQPLAVYRGNDLVELEKRFANEWGDSATRIACELATYAYLTSLNQGYGDAKLAAQAKEIAKAILLNWARTGFQRDGQFMSELADYVERGTDNKNSVQLDVGIMVGPGITRWVQAEDLLLAMNTFQPDERKELGAFTRNMFMLLLRNANYWTEHSYSQSGVYSNHTSMHLVALLSIAQLRQSERDIEMIARGTGGKLLVPWTVQVQENIYGKHDRPKEEEPGILGHHDLDEISTVAPGEIVDRVRAKPYQTFGYPFGSLNNLLLCAEMLNDDGYNSFNYSGNRGQSLLTALRYYGYYIVNFASDEESLVPLRGDRYPSYKQYVGKEISRKGGTTITFEDQFLTPWVVAYPHYGTDPDVKQALAKLGSFDQKCIPFSKIDSFDILRLPSIAEFQMSSKKHH